jgi:hypothetical protein
MPKIDEVTKQVILRCQKSPSFFLDQFGKIQHPKLGIIPFNLFQYQKMCLREFTRNRYTIFKKVRQCGISTVSGGFALWYAMFFNQKRILIVSKRDLDAMDFLSKNVKTIHDNLPEWMRAIWPRVIDNEHEVGFPNGSRIISLTSSKDTLRSHASSLNIVDEAAFVPDMDQMWAAGQPSLQHGGSVIVISTTKGIGNWYWQTWTDAEADDNDFKPIMINWWDMDWELEFKDELSGKDHLIAPTRGIRKCVGQEEIEKYGPYWSPWLEEQYRQLTQKGDSSKFRQEILADFLGTGNTVLSRQTLQQIQSTISKDYKTIGEVDYVNPNTEEHATLNFQHRLWVWDKPNYGRQPNEKTGDLGEPAHSYCMGVDIASGDSNDFSTIQVFDITTQEQVAELQIRTIPRVFARMVDYVGRYYNDAFATVERTGMGVAVCQELYEILMYHSLYRKQKKNPYNKPIKYSDIGFNTSAASKPILNKTLVDNTGEGGWVIKSPRLHKECTIYVHLKAHKTGCEPGKGNTDDLVIATGLCFIGANQAATRSVTSLIPIHVPESPSMHDPGISRQERMDQLSSEAMRGALLPVSIMTSVPKPQTIAQELQGFTAQLGGLPVVRGRVAPVNPKKHIIKHRRK